MFQDFWIIVAAVPKSFHDQSAILKVDKIMHGDKPVNGQYNSLPDVYHVLYYSGGRGGGGGPIWKVRDDAGCFD